MKTRIRILQLVFALSLTLAITVVLARADQARPLDRSFISLPGIR